MTGNEAQSERKPDAEPDVDKELEALEALEAQEQLEKPEREFLDAAKDAGFEEVSEPPKPGPVPKLETELPKDAKVVAEVNLDMAMPPGYDKFVIVAKNDENQVAIKTHGFINDDEATGFILRHCNFDYIMAQMQRRQG